MASFSLINTGQSGEARDGRQICLITHEENVQSMRQNSVHQVRVSVRRM